MTFLEYWKRKSASLAHHWDCLGFQVRKPLYNKVPLNKKCPFISSAPFLRSAPCVLVLKGEGGVNAGLGHCFSCSIGHFLDYWDGLDIYLVMNHQVQIGVCFFSGNGQSRAQKKSLIDSGEGVKSYLGSAQKEGLLFKRDCPKLSTWISGLLIVVLSYCSKQ